MSNESNAVAAGITLNYINIYEIKCQKQMYEIKYKC